MGNVAIAFIESTISFSEYMQIKRQKRIEHKRIRSLIPRYLARLNNSDISITTLNLNGLGVDSQILRLLSYPLLSGTTRVQALYLENNWIGVEGATCIARVLNCKDIVHLKDVSLAHNPVGSVGVTAIASALEQNTSLERLDLSYCDIDDDGVQKLCTSLKKSNTTLQYLNLEGNCISSSGIYSLLKCVYDTSSMTSLWESNHTLRSFYGSGISQRSKIYNKSFPETKANRVLFQQLVEVLATCNRRYSSTVSSSSSSSNYHSRTAAHKILRHYVQSDRRTKNEYWECVEGMEEKLIPNIIGWLTRYGDMGVIYGVLRDLPWLIEPKVASRKGQLQENDSNNMKGSCSNCIEVREEKDDVSLFVGIEERRVPDLVASL